MRLFPRIYGSLKIFAKFKIGKFTYKPKRFTPIFAIDNLFKQFACYYSHYIFIQIED
jgi:hypothetical protein